MSAHYLGIDVGSGSVRAGVFDGYGRCLAQAAHPISQFRPEANFVEQSSDEIWDACVAAVRDSIEAAGIPADSVRAIGFDATCSLVALGADGRPVSVSPTDDDTQNIVMWMDHRATAEAAEITATGHDALRYIGGQVSPELELPKLLWLARNRPDQYERAAIYLDLADYMVARAVGELGGEATPGKSTCTQVCKWLYLAHEGRWPTDLLNRLGLESLLDKPRMAGPIREPGAPAGRLAPDVAEAFGLSGEITVATGLIDAHAGALGMLGDDPEASLAVIAGTSTCHIAFSREPCFVPGVWGPYWGAVLPDGWINEGGQSAVGALIDHVIRDSAAYADLMAEAKAQGVSHFDVLNARLDAMEAERGAATLTRDVHVLDYHHGNRSPLADASLTGIVTGLTLDTGIDDLAVRYLATLQAVSYGTRHIVEALNANGHQVTRLRLCGGILKNERWLAEMADATDLPIELPTEPETVLLGSAMLAVAACGDQPDLRSAAAAMSGTDRVIEPRGERRVFHDAKYRVYRTMHAHQMAYREIMGGGR
ncbi:FGGY-family carbohydrate kinase [Salinisphaera hydrothermalis]|uniref:Ribitol kinase n=1 Tax=Salinisphaera hydrothermalis (strain C41B8) TaxID=1304275 RepID=A0A084II12_SALHC|nr:FGGY-family carbohydrate kinase [Salinisphaera hydrothermalis]KEZ76346.1 ribitol kinase [Salinisphaera hydrothermalis C41B8]